jgi:hypothetical protein
MPRTGTFKRALALALLAAALLGAPTAQAGIMGFISLASLVASLPEFFDEGELPTTEPERRLLESGREALEEGDIARAARHYEAALGANPDSIEGLTLLGLIREQQGRGDLATPLYRRAVAVAELRESTDGITPDPIAAEAPGTQDQAGLEEPAPALSWRDLASLARERLAAMAPAASLATDPRESLAARLEVLGELLAAGLIDVEEHNERRAANIGALLVLGAPPAARVLEGPAPSASDVIARFGALDDQLERGAIDEDRWSFERARILDALLPLEGPRLGALDPLDAAALDGYVKRGVLTAAEANAELEMSGLEGNIAPGPVAALPEPASPPPLPASKPEPPASKTLAKAEPEPEPAPAPTPAVPAAAAPEEPATVKPAAGVNGEVIGIHLAWFRTPEQAQNGWKELLDANRDVLGELKPRITPTDKGDNGVYFRVTAGPLASTDAALQTCAALLTRGFFCETTIY